MDITPEQLAGLLALLGSAGAAMYGGVRMTRAKNGRMQRCAAEVLSSIHEHDQRAADMNTTVSRMFDRLDINHAALVTLAKEQTEVVRKNGETLLRIETKLDRPLGSPRR
jgi:hypothetical protein